MNELRLTNMIENHFYLDFNWKDGIGRWSVSRQEAGLCRLYFAATPFAKVCAQDLP